jgi:hypothetical protein
VYFLSEWGIATLIATLFVCPFPSLSYASPLTITNATNSVRHFGPSHYGPEVTNMNVHADVSPSGSPTSVVATQGGTIIPLNFIGSPTDPNNYSGTILFSSSLTGAWSVSASNGGNTASALTNTIPFVVEIPLVNNLSIVPNRLTPKLIWTLPSLSGLHVNTYLVTVFTSGGAQQIFNLLSRRSSFRIPQSVLNPQETYYFDVTLGVYNSADGLIDTSETYTQQAYNTVNSANTYNVANTSVPEPATWIETLCGFGCLGMLMRSRRRCLANT